MAENKFIPSTTTLNQLAFFIFCIAFLLGFFGDLANENVTHPTITIMAAGLVCHAGAKLAPEK